LTSIGWRFELQHPADRQAHSILADRDPLSANQIHYSLLKRGPERTGLLDACRELGITPVAYSPLEMGMLTGKYDAKNPPPSGTRRFRYSARYLDRIQPLIGLLRELGQAHAGTDGPRTPGQVALNWVICKGAVPIPGAKNARQAQANAGALGWHLTGDEVAALDATSDRVINSR
jgi:aryl-alcohol dehydrogenase-like predicted oxidoreductase